MIMGFAGRLVVIDWPHSDQAGGKHRPAIILQEPDAIENTGQWYRDCASARSAQEFQVQTLIQINQYTDKARSLGLAWTK